MQHWAYGLVQGLQSPHRLAGWTFMHTPPTYWLRVKEILNFALKVRRVIILKIDRQDVNKLLTEDASMRGSLMNPKVRKVRASVYQSWLAALCPSPRMTELHQPLPLISSEATWRRKRKGGRGKRKGEEKNGKRREKRKEMEEKSTRKSTKLQHTTVTLQLPNALVMSQVPVTPCTASEL